MDFGRLTQADAPDQCDECRAAPGRPHAAGCPCRYEVQVFREGYPSPVFDDEGVTAYDADDPVWFSVTTLWDGCETVWMYPVSQITEVRIARVDT